MIHISSNENKVPKLKRNREIFERKRAASNSQN